ncbi:MAG TPA: hypothetical protein VL853_07915 [Gemmatimonadales bacterium]|nr:hypothetical protein [Gemmatimonadales bacterium]
MTGSEGEHLPPGLDGMLQGEDKSAALLTSILQFFQYFLLSGYQFPQEVDNIDCLN